MTRFGVAVTRRPRDAGIAITVAGVALFIDGGFGGAVVAGGFAIAWLLLPAPIAFGIGQAGLVIGLGGDPLTMPVAHGGLFAALATALLDGDQPLSWPPLAVFGIAAVVLVALAVLLAEAISAAVIVALLVAGTLYGLHRYTLLTLGHLEATQ